jgi:hypothetical protein
MQKTFPEITSGEAPKNYLLGVMRVHVGEAFTGFISIWSNISFDVKMIKALDGTVPFFYSTPHELQISTHWTVHENQGIIQI